MRWDGIWRWWWARAWSRRSSKRHRVLVVAGRGRPALHEEEVSGRLGCSKKDLANARPGVARSETLVLSGTGVEDLVALETWPSESEIVNLTKKRRGSYGGSTAVGRVNCRPVVAGSGRAGEETGIASGRFGGGSGPGDGCRRWSGGWRSSSGGREDRVHGRPEGSRRQ